MFGGGSLRQLNKEYALLRVGSFFHQLRRALGWVGSMDCPGPAHTADGDREIHARDWLATFRAAEIKLIYLTALSVSEIQHRMVGQVMNI
jgi:hypothetical protein